MRNLWMILGLLFGQGVYADEPLSDFVQAYQAGSQTGQQALTQSKEREFKIDSLPGFTGNPSEAQHYSGTEQSHNNIGAHGGQTDLSKEIYQRALSRPHYEVNQNAESMKRSTLISNNAANIAHGISNTYVDCKQTRECRTTYTQRTCQQSGGLNDVMCMQDLIVQATTHHATTQTLNMKAANRGWSRQETSFVMDLKTGRLVSQNDRTLQASLTPLLKPFPCDHSMKFEFSTKTPQPQITLTQSPTCNNGFQAGFKVTSRRWNMGGFRVYMPFRTEITLSITSKPPTTIERHWSDGCTPFEQRTTQGLCTRTQSQCTAPNQTRVINGVPITEACWQNTNRYRCGSSVPVNTCEPLRQQGCEQIDSKCIESIDNQCHRFEQTYRCPTQQCTGGNGVICNESTFCLSGNCTYVKPEAAQNVGQHLSALSGIADGSKQFDLSFIFKGTRQTCRKIPVGFLDCCADRGWGRDAGLARCSEGEKKLGHDKERKLVIPTGDYCSRRILGICIQRSNSYCSFPSKLARIVQEQGRIGQLGISMGGGEHPNCRGLTPEELQRIDFQKIDFTDFLEDLHKNMKMPNEANIQQYIRNTIDRYQGRGRPYE